MKAFHLKTAILAVAISALGYWGCSKDSTTLQAQSDANQALSDVNLPTKEVSDQIIAKVKTFEATLNSIKKGENSSYESTPKQAVLDIEALLNTKYGWGNFHFTKSSDETLKIPIDADKEEFNAEEIAELYEQSFQQLRNHYISLEKEDCRQLIFADVNIVREEKGTFFTVTSFYGTSQKEQADSRGLQVNAFAGFLAPSSLCNGAINGPLKLTNQINANKPLLGSNYIFTDLEGVGISSSGFDNGGNGVSGSQLRQAKLYYSQKYYTGSASIYGPLFTCYNDATDHNWYYNNWWYAINVRKPQVDYGFAGITITSFWDYISGISQSGNVIAVGESYYHYGLARYGKIVLSTCCPPPPL